MSYLFIIIGCIMAFVIPIAIVFKKPILLLGVGILLGLFLLFQGVLWYANQPSKESAKSSDSPKKSIDIRTAQIPQVIQQPVQVVYAFFPKKFEFNGKRSIAVYLFQGWKSYPKGGRIRIQTPSGNVYTDKPGIDQNIGWQQDGVYIFYADDENATGVEIYNTWGKSSRIQY